MDINNLNEKLSNAVKIFWSIRENQKLQQGMKTGRKDAGNRSAVTGGKQMDGFIQLIRDLLVSNGALDSEIIVRNAILPGYFRPSKDWDLIVMNNQTLIAILEFKSQVGSFGNNFNNRVEEAIGNSTDLWTAYREGAFKPSQRPWLGYFMLLENHPKSTTPVRISEPHFKIFKEFIGSSYAKRYELFCEKIVRERLYDACCFILSDKLTGKAGNFIEPNDELSFNNFISSFVAKILSSKNK